MRFRVRGGGRKEIKKKQPILVGVPNNIRTYTIHFKFQISNDRKFNNTRNTRRIRV